MLRKFRITGILTALLTPLNEEEEIIEESFKKLIDFQIKNGINGFFPLGTAGEGMKLSLKKRKKAAEIVVKHTAKRVPVIVHIGTQDTEMSIELACHAKKIGAEAISAIGPFFYKPDIKGLIQHYKKISDSVDLPLFVYNYPEKQGYNISPEIFKKLVEKVDGIIGIKDTSYNIEQIQEYVYRFKEKYTIIGAGDSMIFPTFIVGASAHISVLSNIFPKQVLSIYKYFLDKEFEKARLLQSRLNEIRKMLKQGPYLASYKEAVRILHGINLGKPSLPLRGLTKNELKQLEQKIKNFKNLL